MTSIPNSPSNSLVKSQPNYLIFSHSIENAFRSNSLRVGLNRRRSNWRFCVRDSNDGCNDPVSRDGARNWKGLIDALPPAVSVVRRNIGSKFAIGVYISFALLAIAVRQVMLKMRHHKNQGSVVDLVRRGQLRSDRRGISIPLKYEDPFNNPLVKVCRIDSTVEMCGKVYRMAPVTLTEEQQSEHQKRRSRAYQWKRPKVFLKEGDPIPPDVDPDAVRWLPARHPFATTVSDIDEEMAQKNVSQKHGVPSRIKAEHEALQKKLESLQAGQKMSEVAIDLRSIKGYEDANQSSSIPQEQHIEPIPASDQVSSDDDMLPHEMKKKL